MGTPAGGRRTPRTDPGAGSCRLGPVAGPGDLETTKETLGGGGEKGVAKRSGLKSAQGERPKKKETQLAEKKWELPKFR